VEEVVDMEVEVATMIGEVEEDMVVGTMIGDRVDTMIGLEEEATEETVVGTEEVSARFRVWFVALVCKGCRR